MKRTILTLAVTLLLVTGAVAQYPKPAITGTEQPKADLYFGYAHTITDYNNASGGLIQFNGFEADYTGYITRHIGITGSFLPVYGGPFSVKQLSFTVGPKLLLHAGRFEPFITAQFGYARQNSTGMYRYSHAVPPPNNIETGFTYRLGGGLDVPVSQRFFIRVFQADWQRMPWGTSSGVPYYVNVGGGLGIRF